MIIFSLRRDTNPSDAGVTTLTNLTQTNSTTPTNPVATQTRVANATQPRVANASQLHSQNANVRDDNLPIHNAEELVDETIFISGKRVASSKNLRVQRDFIKSSVFYAMSYSNIENHGQCWWYPPTIVKKPVHNINQRWLDFFRLRVFNWMPDASIGNKWKPKCTNCKITLSRNGHDGDPRIVFDQHDNYWLNAPNKYICRDCEYKYKQNLQPANQSYSFRSTNKEIMDEIKQSHPEIIDLFPCVMTTRNAINNQ